DDLRSISIRLPTRQFRYQSGVRNLENNIVFKPRQRQERRNEAEYSSQLQTIVCRISRSSAALQITNPSNPMLRAKPKAAARAWLINPIPPLTEDNSRTAIAGAD